MARTFEFVKSGQYVTSPNTAFGEVEYSWALFFDTGESHILCASELVPGVVNKGYVEEVDGTYHPEKEGS